MKRLVSFLLLLTLFTGCHRRYFITTEYDDRVLPAPPDYSRPANWSALPWKKDPADWLPVGAGYRDRQDSARIDVFFIHPTLYSAKPEGEAGWNASLTDGRLNHRVDSNSVGNQASVFNGAGKIYAPRYRQAHYSVFLTADSVAARKALDLAYADVRKAFAWYLAHWNSGRPFVIASHSQGTIHAIRLLQEEVDGKPLQKQLVAAYLIGRPVTRTTFRHIPPIEQPGQPGTFASWCTFSKEYHPQAGFFREGPEVISTNPLLWNSSETYAPRSLHKGGVGRHLKYYPAVTDAENHQGILWISKPHIPGAFLLRLKNWHVADINMFYGNLRENVALQVENYFSLSSAR
jgi:hypothetical protein